MRTKATIVAVMAMLLAASAVQAVITIDTVTVGNPGNAANTVLGYGSHGAVAYTYNIGKYEVTAGQYTEFLNKVATTDTYRLYNSSMWSSDYGCKIQQTGPPGMFTYSVAADMADRPVNYVSFWDAARFSNWLNNGQPTGAQGPLTTERGSCTLDGYNGSDGRTIHRSADAKWAVTSEDEWYKAAYYNPATGTYFTYPTRSNTAPGQDMNDASGNNANCWTPPGVFPIDSGKYTTVAGEFQNSASPYGTFDQAGNVKEWNETLVYQDIYDAWHGLRGGSFEDSVPALVATYSTFNDPTFEAYSIGFRVFEVPEPATPHDGDSNNDGKVDVVDLGVLAKNYDWTGAPAGTVPEPMTLSLLAVGSLALLRRGGRGR